MSDPKFPLESASPGLPEEVAAAPQSNAGPGPALYSWSAHLRLWLCAILGVIGDIWTKQWAFSTLTPNENHVVIPHVLNLQTSLNRGALWGMGKGVHWMRWVFIVASVFAMVFVLYVFCRSSRVQRSFHLGLGMVLGGALGNLWDRLFNGGRVRDFIKIDLRIGTFELWPWIFNIADVLLVVGVGLLLLNIWQERSRTVEKAHPH